MSSPGQNVEPRFWAELCVASSSTHLYLLILTAECPQWESNPMMTDKGPFVLSCVPSIESERVFPFN